MGDDDVGKLRGLGEGEWFGDAEEEAVFHAGPALTSRTDRRGGDRLRVHMEVRVDPGGRPGTVGDLSIGGVLVYCDVPAPAGSSVEILFLTESGLSRARGIVRWISRAGKRDAMEERSGMGVQFTWVTLGMRAVLDEAFRAGRGHDLSGL